MHSKLPTASPAIPLIGHYTALPGRFADLDIVFEEFQSADFQALSARKQFKRVNQVLLNLIQQAPVESFLLSAAIDYIARINSAELLSERYSLPMFEFWLNH